MNKQFRQMHQYIFVIFKKMFRGHFEYCDSIHYVWAKNGFWGFNLKVINKDVMIMWRTKISFFEKAFNSIIM